MLPRKSSKRPEKEHTLKKKKKKSMQLKSESLAVKTNWMF